MLAHGISGTVKWTLDDEGTLYFVPVDGKEGTFANTKGFQREWEPYKTSVKQIKSHGTINLAANSSYMFAGCSSLTDISGLKNWNAENVRDMSGMFTYCSLTNLDALKNWDTQKITDMMNMFFGCSHLINIDAFKGWNTENVTDMSCMFYGCSRLSTVETLKNWNTQNVTNVTGMFGGCNSLAKADVLKVWNIQNG